MWSKELRVKGKSENKDELPYINLNLHCDSTHIIDI